MPRFLHKVEIENFLSIAKSSVDLRELNVLVGPNGSGKSNFLRTFDFIGEVAERDLEGAIESYGGLKSIVFAGGESRKLFSLRFTGTISRFSSSKALDDYKLSVRDIGTTIKTDRSVIVRREELKIKRFGGRGRRITLEGSELKIYGGRGRHAAVEREQGVSDKASGLALLRKLGEDYDAEQVDQVASLFEDMRLVDINVDLARRSERRDSSRRLRPDASNLSAYLLRLKSEEPAAFDSIEDDVSAILSTFDGFEFIEAQGDPGRIGLLIREKPFSSPFNLDRVSFGTMRAIALFAILNDPAAPKLTCIEEIDHGFHPQALDRLVERLREASKRTQLLVATHSPALVNRLRASELIMFARSSATGATEITRPDPALVDEMREKSGYELGELWFAGLIDES